MKKAIFILIIILLLLSCSLVAFSKDNKSSEDLLKEKVNTQIKFLDTELTNIINRLNGLSFENYRIIATTVGESDKDSASNTEESGGSANQKTSSGESEQSSESAQGSSSSSGSGSNSSSSSEQSSQNSKKYTMTFNSILTDDLNPQWDFVKQKIETFFTSWNTMIIDLYKINVNKQDILDFSANLDVAIQNIKNEDKEKSLISISALYSYIPKFYEACNPENQIELSIYTTKSEILKAYAIVENKSNEEILSHLKLAQESFNNVISNIDNNKSEVSINKTYILINEIQTSIPTRDLHLFFMKYKNLIEEINNIIDNF